MNPAKSERLRKEKNPSAFCPSPNCLWRASSGECPKHQRQVQELPECHTSVSEVRAIQYNDGGKDRRWFHVRFDRPYKRVTLVSGGLLPAGKIFCADHGIDDECVCKAEVRKYIEAHPSHD